MMEKYAPGLYMSTVVSVIDGKSRTVFTTGQIAGTKSYCQQFCMLAVTERYPIWEPSGADRTQVGPTLAPQTLLSRYTLLLD